MNRLFSVTGPSQLIFGLAAANTYSNLDDESDNYIVINNSAGKESLTKNVIENIHLLSKPFDIKKIIEINDILNKVKELKPIWNPSNKKFYRMSLSKSLKLEDNLENLKNDLIERIGVNEFEELYVCKWNDHQERFIGSTYNNANVILHESGLGTYIHTHWYDDNYNFKKRLERTFYRIFGGFNIYNMSHKKNLFDCTALLRPDLCPDELKFLSNKVCRNKEQISEVIADIVNFIDVDERGSSKILLLESSIHRIGLSENKEIELYRKCLNRSLEKKGLIGNEKEDILLKPHPRSDKNHIEKIKNELNIKVVPKEIRHLPVEILPMIYEVDIVTAPISTGLFNLNELYGIRTILPKEGDVPEFIKDQYIRTKNLLNEGELS